MPACVYRFRIAAGLVASTLLVAFGLSSALSCVSTAWAEDGQETVRPVLKADVDSVTPGKPFKAIVSIDIAPGWHIYWKNPGDAGLPTRIKLKLPEGFSSGEIEWPEHLTFKQPGDIIGFGYEHHVDLALPVTPPATLEKGSKVPVTAEVRWLACSSVCVPGSKTVQMELPVS